MNRTLKETLFKLAIETGGDWVTLLPYAIFRVRNSPYVHGLTPFEILYGAPPPIIVRTLPDHDPNVAPRYLASLKALQGVQHEIWPLVHSLYEIKDAPNPEHGIVQGIGYGLTTSGLGSIILTCAEPASWRRRKLRSGSYGDTLITF
ncbi:hypothetical protein mRhiFer1_007862 [Rhinolophus ferrumequinum]|uniref:Uncharacterized protein n=1 Tax=Rhinolophus ferrumequinum TaxID=59479 RepID=A0A7J8AV47_RHIFE|nr:hypothetical protein mRhiFer1_007862 [Rhinolophus ferrumequinum]